MNQKHLELCSSAEWADAVKRWIIPWVLESVELGDNVLEIGPGPGLTTDVLKDRFAKLTAVEIDLDLAADLAARFADTHVNIIRSDATKTNLSSNQFSGAVCLTMLHHVPSAKQQDALLAEVHRLLEPGGVLAGTDSLNSPEFRKLHVDDICIPVDPNSFADRLHAAGYIDVSVDTNDYAFRFRARKG